MAIKKSELYSSIWKSCDELRGGMDASQYKDYVLTLLFMKYVSDKYSGKKNSLITIPKGGSFSDMVALKGKSDIGDQINKIIAKLAEENDLRGVIDLTDFNDEEKLGKGKDMVDRLSNLVAIFENPALNFSKNRADDDDILGDAYEYLMRHFATESGKSKGQFYTPAEVSRILAQVISIEKAKDQSSTVYDPTCGSGSLLLKVAEASKVGLTIYGQEKDNATKALAVMNMWLHGNPEAEIWKGNTLAEPHWKQGNELKKFDFVVANPPFSEKAWSNGVDPQNDLFNRFTGFGVPPAKNGDYAFLLHVIHSLKSTGKGSVILPHGVLFRGNAEATIRENIIKRGYVKGIIGLPANLFYGTGIPACVIVIDKENAAQRKGIFMIDASKGFIKDGNKNRLREQDLHKIVDVFNKQSEVAKFSRMVPVAEIETNEYNLNIPRYIDSQQEEDIQDLNAHLQGGIPDQDIEALGQYWQVYPTLKKTLFQTLRDGYSELKLPKSEIKTAIFAHPEFVKYSQELDKVFDKWKAVSLPVLESVAHSTQPKEFITTISESLLNLYASKALVNRYSIFQHLMDYWTETMKDDLYVLVEDGWQAKLEPVRDPKGKIKKGEFECDLVPKPLVINRYFAAEKANIEKLEQDLEVINQSMQELLDEYGGDEGLLEEVLNDKGKVTKGNLTKRIKDIKTDPEYTDELAVLNQYLAEMDKENKTKADIKSAQTDLNKKVLGQYPKLTEEDVKVLVVDDKWLAILQQEIGGEIDSISQRLTGRIKDLAERYEDTLPELKKEVAGLSDKVDTHLQKMGFVWN